MDMSSQQICKISRIRGGGYIFWNTRYTMLKGYLFAIAKFLVIPFLLRVNTAMLFYSNAVWKWYFSDLNWICAFDKRI